MEFANTVLLAFIAVCNAITPVLWYFVRRDIGRLELNTNSKMDSLLAVTASAEFAKGLVKGKAEKKAGEK